MKGSAPAGAEKRESQPLRGRGKRRGARFAIHERQSSVHRSHVLSAILHERIARGGPISFRKFMEAALYDPGHGYYASGRAVIGRGGDFFTNVSVGPLFGRMLARQFAEMWERLGRPARWTIAEEGAHRGDFAADALEALREQAPECFAAAEYLILEPAQELQRAQEQRLATFGSTVRWVKSWADTERFDGVHFSNELIDAFPVHRVRWTGGEWVERCVASDGARFTWCDGAIEDPALREQLARVPLPLPAGYETEVNLAAPEWIAVVSEKLRRGWVLAIDYGYSRAEFYRPERTGGTLSAYAGHRREPDPLARPGEIDLTAHVEWTSLAERAAASGLRVAGFCDQHRFTVGLSRLHFADDAAITPARAQELRAFKTLMHPGLMGTSFQAICFSCGIAAEPPLSGFAFAGDPLAALSVADVLV